MKKIIYALFTIIILGLYSCDSPPSSQTTDDTNKPLPEILMTGNDRDEYGCIGSAGYQWSVLRNECVRIFVQGIRLDPKAQELDSTLSAFVIFKNDDNEKQAEIFMPDIQKSLILNQVEDDGTGTWVAGELTLKQWRGMYMLDQLDKTIYQGPAVR